MMNTSDPPTTQAEADSPDANRAGPAAPPNIAALLYVVTTLLEFGRHLVATIERRATMPGFSLFVAMFGTSKLPVMLAHLHRGILRATALESLLLRRAATGRDVTIPPLRLRIPPNGDADTHPVDEPVDPQLERLSAERAKYDAPIDPDHLPGQAEIEAEVRNRPYGRTIAAICRDFGVVPGLCTRAFWDALIAAIACHEGSMTTCWQNMQRKSEQFCQAQENVLASVQVDPGASLYPHQTLGFSLGERPVDPFHNEPRLMEQCLIVHCPETSAAAPAQATGPPLCAGMKRAA